MHQGQLCCRSWKQCGCGRGCCVVGVGVWFFYSPRYQGARLLLGMWVWRCLLRALRWACKISSFVFCRGMAYKHIQKGVVSGFNWHILVHAEAGTMQKKLQTCLGFKMSCWCVRGHDGAWWLYRSVIGVKVSQWHFCIVSMLSQPGQWYARCYLSSAMA